MSESILEREPPLPDQRILYGLGPLRFGDLRLPDSPGPHPCAITIHGGFWRNRYDLEHLGHLCAALAASGIATWNIEYRRIGDPSGGWPGTFQDATLASRFLFDNATRYDIDPGRIFMIGHSAGGHLASWLAGGTSSPAKGPICTERLPLRAVVSLAGVLDLRRALELELSKGAVRDLLGGFPDDIPERYAAASPIERLPAGVPHVLLHGDEDDIVPIEISERYHDAALATGDDVTLRTLSGTGHFDLIDPESLVWPEVLAAIRARTP